MKSITERQTDDHSIVIGAGASGLMAACALTRNGGGRIYTLHNHGFSRHVEAGAEFVHGDLSLTSALLRSAGIGITAMKGKMYQLEKGELQQNDFFGNNLELLLSALGKLNTDMTLDEFLRRYFPADGHRDLHVSVRRFVEGYNAADMEKASALALREEWSQDADPVQYRPEGGYALLMESLLQQAIEQGLTIRYATVVSHIRWQPGKVIIETTDGTSYTAPKVLVTVPIGVLQHESIRFSPALPAYQEAARDIGFGSVIKFLLEFKQPFWENLVSRKAHAMKFIFSDAPVPTWWSQLPDETPMLTGWLGGPAVEKIRGDDEHLLDEALRSLSYIFDCPEQLIRGQLKSRHISNWKDDPFSLGAYSYATVRTPHARNILCMPVEDTIYFGGEAVYDGPHTGTVEAALISGKEAAIKMMHAYSADVKNKFK
jgi:monoamine oxidase